MKIPHAVALVLAFLFVPLLLLAQYQPVDKLAKLAYVEAEFTRADDATPYQADFVFSTEIFQYLVFPNAVKVTGGSGYIEAYSIWRDTTKTLSLSLLLFSDTTFLSPQFDNTPYVELWEKKHYEITRIDSIKCIQMDLAFSHGHASSSIPFVAKTKALYGLLMIWSATGYTPKPLEKVRVGLWIRRN